jgi:hypothetical protein
VEIDNDTGLCKGCFSCLNDPPIRIEGSFPEFYYSVQEAYDNLNDGEVIQMRQTFIYEDNIYFDRTITAVIEGGYDCDFLETSGETVLESQIYLEAGNVEIQGVKIK